jgi:hypothetical protein
VALLDDKLLANATAFHDNLLPVVILGLEAGHLGGEV